MPRQKKILVISTTGTAVGYVLCAISVYFKSIFGLLLGRMIMGFFRAVGGVFMAALADFFSSYKERLILGAKGIKKCFKKQNVKQLYILFFSPLSRNTLFMVFPAYLVGSLAASSS